MITFQEETYYDIKDEIQSILIRHSEELSPFNRDKVHLNPKWEWYKTLWDSGMLHIISARLNSELIGYYISIITPHIHYADTLTAENDILYILPEYRKGLTGYKLIRFAVEKLKKKVQVIILSMKAKQSFLPLANRLGFELTDYKLTLET